MTELTCIICPNGCHLIVDDNLNVTGNKCPRGVVYGKQEVTNPTRTVTSTVKCDSKKLRVCPVKTCDAIPKGKMFDVMRGLAAVELQAPVAVGDIVLSDIAGTGANLIAAKTMNLQ